MPVPFSLWVSGGQCTGLETQLASLTEWSGLQRSLWAKRPKALACPEAGHILRLWLTTNQETEAFARLTSGQDWP